MNIAAPIVDKFLELLSTFYLVSSDFQIIIPGLSFSLISGAKSGKMSVRLATPIEDLRHPIKYSYMCQVC